MIDAIFQALTTMLGKEGVWFIYALVDPVEWSDPKYNHQN